jgi:F-type H+-transporting ATPase subunit gamma
MASLRQIRSSLRSVQNTKQIMRAMQLVSGSKFKRAQTQLLQARSTMEFLDGLLQRATAAVSGNGGDTLQHPLCQARRQASTQARGNAESLLVVFTSDAGLCGAYNGNIIQLAEAQLRRDSAAKTRLVFIGRKGHRYFTKRGWQAEESFLDLAGRPNLKTAETIGRGLMQRFLSGQVGSITLLYSRFASASTSQPTVRPWLPVQITSPDLAQGSRLKAQGSSLQPPASSLQPEYIFEPSPERVFADLLPRWALAAFQGVLLEAFTSEHSARMLAMKNATDNAQKMVGELTMLRNKIRQAAITKELSEIVGTAEALK